MNHVVAVLLMAMGTGALCLAMGRHYGLVFAGSQTMPRKYGLRVLGYGGLLSAATLLVSEMGRFVGLTYFVGWLTLCVIAVALTVTWLTETRSQAQKISPAPVLQNNITE